MTSNEVILFQTRYSEHLNSLVQCTAEISELLKVINNGQGRTAHFNKINELVEKMTSTIAVVKRMELREELVKDQINKRITLILRNALEEYDKMRRGAENGRN